MLNDIFSNRYSSVLLWDEFTENDRKILVQGFKIISEQLFPYWINGRESQTAKKHWNSIHDKLAMELGQKELSPKWLVTYPLTINQVCENFMFADYNNSYVADKFIKDRISFIELAFREKHEQLTPKTPNNQERNQAIQNLFKRHPSSPYISTQKTPTELFKESIIELNERLKFAKYPLTYHNGIIQISKDDLAEEQIYKPFWSLTSSSCWDNVDIDMKKALHMRDIGSPDPAFYAAKALESAIKIISDTKNWSHGNEKGAHNYIDNLGSKKNGQFINQWEKDFLKSFFTNVRNPFGHGAGSDDMPKLSPQQTDWAIETCMSWIKNLITRS
ncbi:AbiJ-NTD4 domain-containing protein [Maridesulfovibrio sp.]|uniref:AbiJ-NTD4 domain-containing protein n=1 Tax=Maridesulfovibrio sp. TaxID=2795000 RepID=UPI0039EF29BC